MNLPTTFDPIAYTREVENAARAAGWTVRHLWPMEIGPRPWFQRVAPDGDRASPKLYLSAGIHGDEISGPQSEWARARRADEPGRNRPQPGLPELQVARNQGPHRVTADSGTFRRVNAAARGLRGDPRLSLRAERHARSGPWGKDYCGDGTP